MASEAERFDQLEVLEEISLGSTLVRGQVSRQKKKYGAHLFQRDMDGKYVCFFRGCGAKLLGNFSRHVARHELDNDEVDSSLVEMSPNMAIPRLKEESSSSSRTLTFDDCKYVLDRLLQNEFFWVFAEPVDPNSLSGIEDYFEVVKKPMDLGTIRQKIVNGEYTDIQDFTQDVQLVWTNAFSYNRKGSDIYRMAEALEQEFNIRMKHLEVGSIGEPSVPTWSFGGDVEDTEVCGKCGEAGSLLICDGNCSKAYHLGCVGLSSEPTTSKWFCDLCLKQQEAVDKSNFIKERSTHRSFKGPSVASLIAVTPTTSIVVHPYGSRIGPASLGINPDPPPFTISQTIPFSSDMLVQQTDDYQILKSCEDKVKRRKVEEELKSDFMNYDPFWNCWKTIIPRREFVEHIDFKIKES